MTPQEEALRRIADAKASNAALLDLGDLRLEEVPKELGELTQLRVLALGKRRPYYDETSRLKWEYHDERPTQPFRAAEPLRNLTGLASLNLSFCEQLTSLDALRGLTGLTALDLRWCKRLTSLDALRGLTGLLSLDLN